MRLLRLAPALLGVVTALGCGGSDTPSGGGFGGTAPGTGGTGVAAPGCTMAPDCGGCTSCTNLCVCEGKTGSECNTLCSGAGGTGAMPGTGGTGAMPATGGAGGMPATGGTAGMPGTGGSGGTAVNGMGNFTWPETAPGTGRCEAGRYYGRFDSNPAIMGDGYRPSAFFVPLPIPVNGTVDLTINETATGEFQISNGRIEGIADAGVFGMVPYGADLVGELDCVNFALKDAQLINGSYMAAGVPTAFSGPPGSFSAQYDSLTRAFVNGRWEVFEQDPNFGGRGAWGAGWCQNPGANCP